MALLTPTIGTWYRRPNGSLFEVVAVDSNDATVEVQFFDGTIDEIEFDVWTDLLIEAVGAPEDWSGSYDLDRDDYGVDLELTGPTEHMNPFDELD